MILGVGTDLIEIERVRTAYANPSFRRKYFTALEIELIGESASKAAGNFAVKEAVAKVFGCGFSGFSPVDIEVLRDELGKPYVNLFHGAKEMAKNLGLANLQVSISNTKEFAMAYAVGEKEEPKEEKSKSKIISKERRKKEQKKYEKKARNKDKRNTIRHTRGEV